MEHIHFKTVTQNILQVYFHNSSIKNQILLLLVLIFYAGVCFSQQPAAAFPKITGCASIVHSIATFDKNGATFNFSKSYTVGFPMAVNILKSSKAGFSFEIVPFIHAENGTSRVSNLLFHPGAMFFFKHGFTFIARMAFETSGRYGLTPVFNQILLRAKHVNYFVSGSLPLRTGNNIPSSIGISIQLGILF